MLCSACSSSDFANTAATGGLGADSTGGASSVELVTGGSATIATGGSVAPLTGGAGQMPTGGAMTTGGSPEATGGQPATGGQDSTGGTKMTTAKTSTCVPLTCDYMAAHPAIYGFSSLPDNGEMIQVIGTASVGGNGCGAVLVCNCTQLATLIKCSAPT